MRAIFWLFITFLSISSLAAEEVNFSEIKSMFPESGLIGDCVVKVIEVPNTDGSLHLVEISIFERGTGKKVVKYYSPYKDTRLIKGFFAKPDQVLLKHDQALLASDNISEEGSKRDLSHGYILFTNDSRNEKNLLGERNRKLVFYYNKQTQKIDRLSFADSQTNTLDYFTGSKGKVTKSLWCGTKPENNPFYEEAQPQKSQETTGASDAVVH